MVRTGEQRDAHNAYMRLWKRNNKEKVNAINLRVKKKNPELYRRINRESMTRMREQDPARFAAIRWASREKNPELYLWNHARKRAAHLDVAFDLEPHDIEIPSHCPVLGMKLEWGFGQRASANKASPSIDRFDPKKGYVRGNVFVISNRANHLKNNGTLYEFRRIVAYMRGDE